jgi:CheY-like chemotaxis protein/HPt (histidine-containing phosphotransfer) domain-containing protein
MLGTGSNQQLPTVLIIDDDMVSREVMATVLTMSGYTIHTASQGEEAVALLDAGTCQPEVVLMDAQMPGLRGRALVDALRARSNASIYAMSGSDVPEDVKRAVDGHLSKPFGPQALQQLLEQHLIPSPARDAEPEAPVVKAETLAQLRAMMSEKAVREIFAAVITDLAQRQAALKKALSRGDKAETKRIGHAIKGGCGMAGAMQAARIGARLEASGDPLDNSSALVAELEEARRNLERMLDAEFPLA